MRKIFVLDTNILIHDPKCIYNFRGNDVILPIYVVEEIDKLKRNQNTAIQARMASRVLDEIRNKGSLATVSYTHLTLPTNVSRCRSRWSPYH